MTLLPLHAAVTRADEGWTLRCLEGGADIDEYDDNNWTALVGRKGLRARVAIAALRLPSPSGSVPSRPALLRPAPPCSALLRPAAPPPPYATAPFSHFASLLNSTTPPTSTGRSGERARRTA